MYIVLELDDLNINNVFFQEKVKNTVMDNSNFSRVIYSNELFMLNGIFVKFALNLQTVEKSFNKYKCLFDVKLHSDIISKIYTIEKKLMERHLLSNKTPVCRISEQLMNGFLKIFNEAEYMEKNEFILKIYGIWENDCEYGLTYKFISIPSISIPSISIPSISIPSISIPSISIPSISIPSISTNQDILSVC
jgi:hypothetical protein